VDALPAARGIRIPLGRDQCGSVKLVNAIAPGRRTRTPWVGAWRASFSSRVDTRVFTIAIWALLNTYYPIACHTFKCYVLGAVTLIAPEILKLQSQNLKTPADRKRLTGRERAEWDAKKLKLGPAEKAAQHSRLCKRRAAFFRRDYTALRE